MAADALDLMMNTRQCPRNCVDPSPGDILHGRCTRRPLALLGICADKWFCYRRLHIVVPHRCHWCSRGNCCTPVTCLHTRHRGSQRDVACMHVSPHDDHHLHSFHSTSCSDHSSPHRCHRCSHDRYRNGNLGVCNPCSHGIGTPKCHILDL